MFRIGDRVKVGSIQNPHSRRFRVGEGVVVGVNNGGRTLLVSFDNQINPSFKEGWSNDVLEARIELLRRKIDNVE